MTHNPPITLLPEGEPISREMLSKGLTWNTSLSETPLVSIVVTVYNKMPYLKNTLQCLFAQTHPNIEIIFVDDCSTDGSREYLETINDPRVVVILNETNLGPGGAANVGMMVAKGELIARLDADDISFPQRIEAQVQAFKENPQLVLCSFCTVETDEDGGFKAYHGIIRPTDEIRGGLLHANVVTNMSSIMVRPLYAHNGRLVGFPNWRSAIDYAFYSTYALCGGEFVVLDSALGSWRLLGDGITRKRPGEQAENARRIAEFLRQNLPLDRDWGVRAAFAALKLMLTWNRVDPDFVLRMLREIPEPAWKRLELDKADIWRIVKEKSPYRFALLARLARHGSAGTRVRMVEYGVEFILRRLGMKVESK